MLAFAPGSNWRTITRRWVIASSVSGPTKWVAASVMMAVTWCPAFCRPLATSTAL